MNLGLHASFQYLTWAENAEGVMTEFLSEHRSLLFEQFGDPDHPLPTVAQEHCEMLYNDSGLEMSSFFLREGVRVFPWQESEDPFEIQWPYFNQNREAFLRTQEVLECF